VRTASVAVLVVVAVAASAFSLEAAGLRPPPHANRVAARAAEWLLGYRYVTSRVDVGGRTIEGRCFHGWFDGRRRRGTLLALSNGGSVRTVGSRRIVATHAYARSALGALELAGCTYVLGPRLAALAEFDGGVRLKPAWLGGRHVLAVHLHRLIVLVAPRSDRPVGVLLHGLKSRLRLRALTPSLSRRLQDE
jgi:hypothetical protein